ncbi:hypothetical protein SPI_00121 [Niveomyces insectorum RCEF 264]|uniref:Uncharacterized protein n=1 Tax=Niveomyces insectorum RCEF 264 TaxID=1081102 RepID=A0A167ZUM9_9HYPO|nr:hypothetical protein SPI_00121 [Niveomyces insectorum RCEF 264]
MCLVYEIMCYHECGHSYLRADQPREVWQVFQYCVAVRAHRDAGFYVLPCPNPGHALNHLVLDLTELCPVCAAWRADLDREWDLCLTSLDTIVSARDHFRAEGPPEHDPLLLWDIEHFLIDPPPTTHEVVEGLLQRRRLAPLREGVDREVLPPLWHPRPPRPPPAQPPAQPPFSDHPNYVYSPAGKAEYAHFQRCLFACFCVRGLDACTWESHRQGRTGVDGPWFVSVMGDLAMRCTNYTSPPDFRSLLLVPVFR